MVDDTVPMPYGKVLPNLAGCSYPNDPELQYLSKILCPNCKSDNVVGINPLFNAFVDDVVAGLPSWGRWFCISCCDSWRYELER